MFSRVLRKLPISDVIKFDNDEICLSKTYFNDIVYFELFNSKYKYLLDENNKFLKIYLIRIWICKYDNYVYKIGSTTNLMKRIKSLNSHFDSCGRIIILFAANIKGKWQEDDAHKKLLKYKINENIQNINKPHSCEIYFNNVSVYDCFLNYIQKITANNKKKYFETIDYVIMDNNQEMTKIFPEYKKLKGFSKLNLDKEKEYIYLDNNENIYWKIMQLRY
jgi:hypothetical protein